MGDTLDAILAKARRAYSKQVERKFVDSFAFESATVDVLRKENAELRKQVANLQSFLQKLHDLLWKTRAV